MRSVKFVKPEKLRLVKPDGIDDGKLIGWINITVRTLAAEYENGANLVSAMSLKIRTLSLSR
ncbi:MAG: hypothetical protein A3I66_23165 [Burkholderiales bacterium RIFCSPLOWO2_02_FULL_57_36]|nr:MAG: hypothetical protein A3I66_23165 [Burkholderiales bacterium RIFCSPLOWO2_02_FULL_57_36]